MSGCLVVIAQWREQWWLKSVALGSIPSHYQLCFYFPLSTLFVEFSVYLQCEMRTAKYLLYAKIHVTTQIEHCWPNVMYIYNTCTCTCTTYVHVQCMYMCNTCMCYTCTCTIHVHVHTYMYVYMMFRQGCSICSDAFIHPQYLSWGNIWSVWLLAK